MSYQKLVITTNLQLSWVLPFEGDVAVADYNDIEVATPSSENTEQALSLPMASSAGTGVSFVLNNIGALTCPVYGYGGIPFSGAEAYQLKAGAVALFYLTDNSTVVGEWQVIPFGGGQASITSISATGIKGVVIKDKAGNTNPTITSPGGTLNIAVSPSINNIETLNTTSTGGLLTVTAVNPITYSTVTLTAGSNLTVTSGDGKTANPMIALNNTLAGLTEVGVGNTVITDGSIASSSNIKVNNVTIDSSGNISTEGTIVSGSGSEGAGLAKAFVYFSDTGKGCQSSITIQDSYNISTITGSAGQYTITFEQPFTAGTYVPVATLSIARTPTTLFPYLVYIGTKQTSSFVLTCTDLQGNYLAPVGGVSVVVFAS